MNRPTPPGWYADPWNPQQSRWWDGTQWSWQTAANTPAPPQGSAPRPPMPPPPPPEPQTPAWKQLWVIAAALIVVLLIVVAAISTDDTSPAAHAPAGIPTQTPTAPPPKEIHSHHPPASVVPRLKGLALTSARHRLRNHGLVAGSVIRKPSHRKPGTVISQGIRTGSHVSRHHAIRLVVASRPPRIPNVIGQGKSSARHDLQRAGFRVHATTRRTGASSPGTVISQSPRAGHREMPRSLVIITVAVKPPPPPSQPSNCTPGYSPCLTPAYDYDCAGGSGDGPEYVYGTVRVTGSDPYGLDSDNDGWGCE